MGYFSPMPTSPRLIIQPDRLRTLRLTALMTQGQLADAAGVHEATISQLEDPRNDSRNVFPGTVRKIAMALRVDPDRFSEVVTEEVAS